MHYSIDDQHGTNICGGIQLEQKARETAQEYADDLDAPVRIYSSKPGDDGETVYPRSGKTTHFRVKFHADTEGNWCSQCAGVEYATRAEAEAAIVADETAGPDCHGNPCFPYVVEVEGAIVHPSRKTRIESLTLSQIERLNREATSAGDAELAANCALLAAAVRDSGTVDVEYAIESSELRSAELLECARIIVAAINDAEAQA